MEIRGVDATLKAEIVTYRAEARFFERWLALVDMFGERFFGNWRFSTFFILNMQQE
jgi:hypothetical protein